MHEVILEQIGLTQHWLPPNLRIYKNLLTQNLILVRDLGIEERLVDKDYPTLYPWKKELIRLKQKFADEDNLAADLGETSQAKQFIPSDYNNSAFYYIAKISRTRCIEMVNDPYTEVTLESEEERSQNHGSTAEYMGRSFQSLHD